MQVNEIMYYIKRWNSKYNGLQAQEESQQYFIDHISNQEQQQETLQEHTHTEESTEISHQFVMTPFRKFLRIKDQSHVGFIQHFVQLVLQKNKISWF